ncbi:MAG: hypothetical protein JOZ65_15775 [Chloroflexi bacterium]|nr:hypothetical protein [Chloroflexota bacterium]
MKIRDFAARYWPQLVPATFIAVLSAIFPSDWSPLLRVAVAVGILLLGAGLRASQDWATEHQAKRRGLFQRLVRLVNDFEYFFRTTPSQDREVSAFQAAAALYNENQQLVADWFYGMEQSRTVLGSWRFHLAKRLEVMDREQRYSTAQLSQVINELSQLAHTYQEEIADLRRRWDRPGLKLPKAATDAFDRFYPEYNTWLLQFRTFREDAAKMLGVNLDMYSLMQQPALSLPSPALQPAPAPTSEKSAASNSAAAVSASQK